MNPCDLTLKPAFPRDMQNGLSNSHTIAVIGLSSVALHYKAIDPTTSFLKKIECIEARSVALDMRKDHFRNRPLTI
jgi:hypothetical protein